MKKNRIKHVVTKTLFHHTKVCYYFESFILFQIIHHLKKKLQDIAYSFLIVSQTLVFHCTTYT